MILCREDILRGYVIHKRKDDWDIRHTQDDQVTSAPRATNVSISTAVCIVLEVESKSKNNN